MVTVCIPSYKESNLLVSAIRSCQVRGIDNIIVFEGPVEGAPRSDGFTIDSLPYDVSTDRRLYVQLGDWRDDADKRSAMLRFAKAGHPGTWIFWLDADEILLWGEYLPDLIARAEGENGAGGFRMRLVELDGSVSWSYNKIIRSEYVEEYIHSIATVQLVSGLTVSLPNEQICGPGGVPVWNEEREGRRIVPDDLATLRPPLHGEPHVLHRSLLRPPDRGVERQSDAEARWYEKQGTVLGL